MLFELLKIDRRQFVAFIVQTRQVGLGDSQYARLGQQLGVVLLQLIEQNLILRLDIGAGSRNHEEQHGIALYVSKEPQTESLAFARTLDDTGDICHTERPSVAIGDDAELRRKGCERIVRDLRFGGRDDAEQRRFACVRKSDQTNICQHFELHDDGAFLRRFAGLRITRSLIGSRTEMPVA